jgi:hypothetical protein
MSGTSILLLASGLSTGVGLGFTVWGWRTSHYAVAYLGAGMLLQGLVVLAFFAVWTMGPSSR